MKNEEIQLIKVFSVLAEQYCQLVNEYRNYELNQFFSLSRSILTEIYVMALKLPNILAEKNDPDPERITHEEWSSLNNSLSEYLGEKDLYYEYFNPYDEAESGPVSLADDLSDIYRELICGLNAYKTGTDSYIRAAIWSWRFSFYAHWGEHLIKALHPLHQILEEQYFE